MAEDIVMTSEMHFFVSKYCGKATANTAQAVELDTLEQQPCGRGVRRWREHSCFVQVSAVHVPGPVSVMKTGRVLLRATGGAGGGGMLEKQLTGWRKPTVLKAEPQPVSYQGKAA